MFTADDLLTLLTAVPFVPFRLVPSDGGSVAVRRRDFVTAGRRYAVVGIVDPAAPDAPFDRHAVVWYLHGSRVETLVTGRPPFSEPPPAGPRRRPRRRQDERCERELPQHPRRQEHEPALRCPQI